MLEYWKNRAIMITPQDSAKDILEKTTLLRPDARQLDWQEMGFSVFVHFGINTYTDREWGEGTEDPTLFNPVDLDARQWVKTVKESGAGLLILTCKHHDGFCLWPSKYTEHSIKNSPYKNGKGDIVREVSDACHEFGIKFGVYYSPWDRHEHSYGTESYNDYYKKQLTELLTEYGDVYEYWLDGACGEGPNGKKQVYDWIGYWSLAKQLQPSIMVTGVAPDVRWCGNEAGICREEEWSQVFIPEKSDFDGEKNDDNVFAWSITQFNLDGECRHKDLLGAHAIENYTGKSGWLMWYPPMVDTSIRPGWFYHATEDEKVRSVEDLIDLYLHSAGGNSMLLLNIPPDRRGLFHENDVANMKALGDYIKRVFSNNLLEGSTAFSDTNGQGIINALAGNEGCWATEARQATITFTQKNAICFNIIELEEYIENGQSVSSFNVEILSQGEWKEIAKGFTIGARRLIKTEEVVAQSVRVNILDARSGISLRKIRCYKD